MPSELSGGFIFFVKVLSYFSININKCILLIYYHIDRNGVYGQYFYYPFKLYKDDHLYIIEEELKMSKKIRINIYDLAMFLNDHAKMALRGDYNNPKLAEFIKQYNERLQEVSFYGYDEVNNAWYKPNMSVSIKAIRLMFNLSNTTNIVLLDIAIFTPGRMDKVLESYKTKPNNSIRKERRRMKVKALIIIHKSMRSIRSLKFSSIARYIKRLNKTYWNKINDGK